MTSAFLSRRTVAGVVVALAYVAAVLFTRAGYPAGAGRVLFDGFAPPAPYRWVNPPAELREGNRRPARAKGDAPLGETGSDVLSIATSDGQAFVSLPTGAVPPRADETEAELSLTPVDASKLGPLPNSMRAEGNAYRIEIHYRPSNTASTTFTAPGTVALTASGPATDLAYSPDGRSWRLVPTRALGGEAGLSGPLEAPGYVVTAGFGHPYKLGGGSRGLGPLSIAGLSVLVFGTVVLVGLIARKPRRGAGS